MNTLMETLNNFAGLFSLLAVLAAIVVPIVLYKIERKHDRQAKQDELEAMNGTSRFPMSNDERLWYTRKHQLEKELNNNK